MKTYTVEGGTLIIHKASSFIPSPSVPIDTLVVKEGVKNLTFHPRDSRRFKHIVFPISLKAVKGLSHLRGVKSLTASTQTEGIWELFDNNCDVEVEWRNKIDYEFVAQTLTIRSYDSLVLPKIPHDGYYTARQLLIEGSFKYIAEDAFQNLPYLEMVSISAPVEIIGKKAFNRHLDLRMVYFPDTLKVIDDSAFMYCEKLHLLKLPNALERIGNNAFSYCNSLKKLYIPDSVTQIDYFAFSDCKHLHTVNWSISCDIIPTGCFSHCISLEHFHYSARYLKGIAESAFGGCVKLPEVPYAGY